MHKFNQPQLLLLLTIFLTSTVSSQNFKKIESLAGLAGLSKNNGVAVADYDGDYDLDIFIVANTPDRPDVFNSKSRLFRNDNNGFFTDVTDESRLTSVLTEEEIGGELFFGLNGFKIGAYWGDYNNDGFPDIFLTSFGKVELFKNNADGTFSEVTQDSGIAQNNGCHNTGAAWLDFNNDGYLDLSIAEYNGCGGNLLYQNNGDETFINVTAQSNIATGESYPSYVIFPFDFNNDGWQDFYVSNDRNHPNTLFINQSGNSFMEQVSEFGMNSTLFDMGVAIGDPNGDGFFDFLSTGIDENSFWSTMERTFIMNPRLSLTFLLLVGDGDAPLQISI